MNIVYGPKFFLVYLNRYYGNKLIYGRQLHENVSLECETFGRPLPTVTWYKSNVELSDNERYNITYVNKTDTRVLSTLSLSRIENEDYADDYVCKTTNKFGSDELSFELMSKS